MGTVCKRCEELEKENKLLRRKVNKLTPELNKHNIARGHTAVLSRVASFGKGKWVYVGATDRLEHEGKVVRVPGVTRCTAFTSTLVAFGLLRRQKEDSRDGYYKVTKMGFAFLNGKVKVTIQAWGNKKFIKGNTRDILILKALVPIYVDIYNTSGIIQTLEYWDTFSEHGQLKVEEVKKLIKRGRLKRISKVPKDSEIVDISDKYPLIKES